MTVTSKDIVKTEGPRAITPVSPFETMERWFEDLWRRAFSLFGPSLFPEMRLTEHEMISPSVDIYEEGNDLVLKADLPGIKKDDISIGLTDNVLTISGSKKKEEKVERENYYRYERSSGSFSRRFELPEGIDPDKIKAHYDNGVLELRIPKTEEAKKHSKKINVD